VSEARSCHQQTDGGVLSVIERLSGPNPPCPKSVCPYSLFDFFNFSQKAQPFVPITTASYQPSTFENWGVNDGNVATDPDTDAYDSAQ
jgi:hypothetical protein